ncbi:hypothetical protein EfmJHP35_01080 [Enterococcus faecium]|nr:hypothetical protein EfmJHP35_01080 [Enterococcus faecium]
MRTRGEQLRFEEQEATNQLQNIINELERFEKEKQISTFETRELQQFIEDYEKQTNELKDKQTDLESQRQKIDEEIKSLSQESDQMEARRARIRKIPKINERIIGRIKKQFNHLQIQLRGARVQKAEATERQEAIEKQLATLTADFSDHEVTEESLEKQINELYTKAGAAKIIFN